MEVNNHASHTIQDKNLYCEMLITVVKPTLHKSAFFDVVEATDDDVTSDMLAPFGDLSTQARVDEPEDEGGRMVGEFERMLGGRVGESEDGVEAHRPAISGSMLHQLKKKNTCILIIIHRGRVCGK